MTPESHGRRRFPRLAAILGSVAVVAFLLFVGLLARNAGFLGAVVPAKRAVPGAAVARISGGLQTVTTPVGRARYLPIVVQKGLPVRWILTAASGDLNSCNGTLIVPRYGIRKTLWQGRTLIEFTPTFAGTVPFSCSMGMIRSSILVVDDITRLPVSGPRACAVPTDEMGIAKKVGAMQTVEVSVAADGYHPALIVIQRGLPTRIHFTPVTIVPCNSLVEFPGYPVTLDLGTGAREASFPEALADFTFRCGQGMLHGYVKVVDDTASFDRAAVARQVDAYLPGDTGAAACCGY